MPVRYLCDSCGFRGVDPSAQTADEVLCEMCGKPVLDDPYVDHPPRHATPRAGPPGRRTPGPRSPRRPGSPG